MCKSGRSPPWKQDFDFGRDPDATRCTVTTGLRVLHMGYIGDPSPQRTATRWPERGRALRANRPTRRSRSKISTGHSSIGRGRHPEHYSALAAPGHRARRDLSERGPADAVTRSSPELALTPQTLPIRSTLRV